MSTARPLRLGLTGVVLLAAALALVFVAPQVRQAPIASAGAYYNCPGGAGAVLISSGATCSQLYPSCVYGGCAPQCNYGSCLQACSGGYTAAGCPLSNCFNNLLTPTCAAYAQTYCQTLTPSYYGATSTPGCSTNYNCGLGYTPYGCTVRANQTCAQSVNNAPQQCTPQVATSNCPGSYSALASCTGGVLVCPGTGQLASATTGCSVTPNSGPSGVNGVSPSECSGGTFASTGGCSASVVLQTCAGSGATATSSSQCPVSCSNGQVLPPGSSCPSGASASTGSNVAGSVSLKAGWNLASFPAGTQVSGTDAPLYALPPGSSAYQTLTSPSSVPSGQGYWLHMPSPTQIALAQIGAGSATIQLPPGQTVLIGNPGDTQATVTGADVVWVYDSTAGWTQTTTLNPGQGAFAESAAGGTATITYGATPGLPS
jgi:hypothetical protein